MKLSAPLVHKVVPFPAAVIRLLVWSLGAKVASFFPGKQYKVFCFFCGCGLPSIRVPMSEYFKGVSATPQHNFQGVPGKR